MFNRENLITWMHITYFGDTMKKWSLFLIMVLLLSLVPGASMGLVKGDKSLQHTVSITPTDDKWIDEGGYVDSKTYRLRVGTYLGSEARTYLKFNLSELGIPPKFIISVTLNLYAYYHYGSESHNITVYGVADNWNEYTINWANKPQNLTNALDWQLGRSKYKWYSWNVTDFVKSELDGDKVVSFMLHSNLSHEPIKDYIYFASKETSYTDEKPYLEIVYWSPISISSINVPKSAFRNQPFKIKVILQNNKILDENVTFLLYVDGQLFKNETVLLKANSSKELSYEYTFQTLGTHQIKAELGDYDTKYSTIKVVERPMDIMNRLTAFYDIRYVTYLKPQLDEKYSSYLEIISELKEYGVDLGPLEDKIGAIDTNIPLIEGYYSEYLELKGRYIRPLYPYPLMSYIRNAFLLTRETINRINEIMPILNETLIRAKESPENQTQISLVRVLVDSSHGQYYNDQRLQTLITKMEDELGWLVDVNNEKLTPETLSYYNVLIITNPRSDITDEEAQAIKEWVENGGGLLITGDWYAFVYYRSLNKVTEEFGIRFNDDELMDDERNTGRPYFPLVGEFNLNHPAMKFLNESSQLYYNGDTLDVSGNAVWLIRGYETSYAEGENNEISKEKGSKPIVAAAVEVGNGRIVAYGSSKAISDDYYGRYIDSNWPFLKGVLLWLAGEI